MHNTDSGAMQTWTDRRSPSIFDIVTPANELWTVALFFDDVDSTGTAPVSAFARPDDIFVTLQSPRNSVLDSITQPSFSLYLMCSRSSFSIRTGIRILRRSGTSDLCGSPRNFFALYYKTTA